MGLFKNKNRGGAFKCTFFLHFHSLSPWPAAAGNLCVSFERGTHSDKTQPSPPHAPLVDECATYVWEQQLQLPATLYEVWVGTP